MFHLMRVVLLAGLLGNLPGLVSCAWAVFPPPIKDDGKFFSKDAIEKANKKIRAIYQNYKKDVVVVTLAGLNFEQARKLDEEGKTKFFGRMAREASVDIGLNGIMVVLCKKPTHLQVHMDPDTQKKAFTTANRKTLIDKIVAQFKEDNFDAGLLEGLDAIEAALKANSK
jgi:uncharacterized membrane protein YgcG